MFWRATREKSMKLLVPFKKHIDSLEKTQIPELINLIKEEASLPDRDPEKPLKTLIDLIKFLFLYTRMTFDFDENSEK